MTKNEPPADTVIAAPRRVRQAEIVGALSIATDIGMGQPVHFGLRTAVLSAHLADRLGASSDDASDAYYAALLRYAGCTADADIAADAFGDEGAMRGGFADVDWTSSAATFRALLTRLGEGSPPLTRARMVAHAFLTMPKLYRTSEAHCEVAQQIAGRMGMPHRVRTALDHIFERWDGKSLMHRARGEEIALPMRIVAVAQDAVTYCRLGGADAARAMVRQRSGSTFDPAVAARFLNHSQELLAGAMAENAWETFLAAEPGIRPCVEGENLETALRAMADFTDLKSPYLRGHSTGVALLAEAAGRRCRLPDEEIVALRWAGLIHDIGRVGVSAGVWGREGPLSEEEWERVRLHPYYTERVLSRCEVLRDVAEAAALHHERLDGSGYHRRLPALMLPFSARILAAADVYRAMTEDRPHRPALPSEHAERALRVEVKAGRLDAEATDAVLAAAGRRVRRQCHPGPAGLSDREIEVLVQVARGLSNREIAARLVISRATVDHHIRHIYTKIGVSTRAAATVFALQHDLLHDTVPV